MVDTDLLERLRDLTTDEDSVRLKSKTLADLLDLIDALRAEVRAWRDAERDKQGEERG